MRPRLFGLMLAAFALVIVLGIGGMVGFFGLAVAGVLRPDQTTAVALEDVAALQAESVRTLASYYAAHGSWEGVRPQLNESDFGPGPTWLNYVLIDAGGTVVATTESGMRMGLKSPPIPPLTGKGVPIEVNGQQVGTFYIAVSRFNTGSGAPRWQQSFARGFISAALGLAAVLLGLATFFSTRISRPLRRLTRAAQTLTAGDMSVRVQGHPIREINELAQAFNTMADSLAQADQQRRQLTADVAHELRTPLSIIKGRLEGMQDGVYHATPEQIAGLLDETALLERLIEDLRLLALADAGQLPLYPEPVEPIPLLYDLADSFAQNAAQRGVALRLDLPDDLPDIQADPQRIAQVLSNMLSNALRYTPTGGSVTLRARVAERKADIEAGFDQKVEARKQKADKGQQLLGDGTSYRFLSDADLDDTRHTTHDLILEVIDTGSGIAPDDLPHIFDRFWRADRARTRSSGGAGLGLAIARRIVEAHGGQIWASSIAGQGTTLAFSLPVAEAFDAVER